MRGQSCSDEIIASLSLSVAQMKCIEIKSFIDFLGSPASNSSISRSPEGVDLADDYQIEVTHRGTVIDSTRTTVCRRSFPLKK